VSTAGTVAADHLRAFIERIERLEEEKRTIADDIKDIYAEAKGTGFDTKAIRTIVKLRKKDQAEREEEEAILDTYMAALGMLPLFDTDRSYANGTDREDRRKRRMSESMDDAKALSEEAARLGLIDPAAHAETIRLTDAIANKYGAGVIDPITGEIHDNQEQPETATQMDRAEVFGNSEQLVAAGSARKATATVADTGSVSHAGAGEIPATNPPSASAPHTGLSSFPEHEVDASSGSIQSPSPTSSQAGDSAGEGVLPLSPATHSDDDVPAFLKRAAEPVLNERCANPDRCKFGHHPQKVTCATCSTAWAVASRKTAVPA